MSVRVQCPSCGGPVVFAVGSSMVAVCSYCRSAVARSDRSVEDIGKVAALVDTGAILKVGLVGTYEGQTFRLTGRTQLGHAAGGVWDEWYAAFDGNRWGWLSEAQGHFYLLFEEAAEDESLPDFDELDPGDEVDLDEIPVRTVVAEVGTATVKGAEGELPFRIVPNSTYSYADLSTADDGFATLDYSQAPPALYVGREVTLDDLGIPKDVRPKQAFELREVKAKKIACPNCGGPLELRAPDRTERVGCPYCGSMLDATRGELTLLNALQEPPFQPLIPLGSTGKFGDDERMAIGAVQRSVTVEGVDYFWYEYLLYHPRDGFEWLVCSDNHWTRVKGVPVAAVDDLGGTAKYAGRKFKRFQSGIATVRAVLGECYWKVSVGDRSGTVDFIAPPQMLSCEYSRTPDSKEVNWSVGSYLTPSEVRKAFDLESALPSPKGVAPNQVFPYKSIYKLSVWFIAALVVLGIVLTIAIPSRKVYETTFQLRNSDPSLASTPGAIAPAADKTQIFFTEPFDLKANRNVRVTVRCPEMSGWVAVEGDLVQKSNGLIQPFFVPLTYYKGVEDGEEWTEGSTEGSTYLSAQPAGQYSIRVEVEKELAATAGPLSVRVDQGSSSGLGWFCSLGTLGIVPFFVCIYHFFFHSSRWSNSSIAPYFLDDDEEEEPVELDPDAAEPPPIPLAAEPPPIPLAAVPPPLPGSFLPVARPATRPPRRSDDAE